MAPAPAVVMPLLAARPLGGTTLPRPLGDVPGPALAHAAAPSPAAAPPLAPAAAPTHAAAPAAARRAAAPQVQRAAEEPAPMTLRHAPPPSAAPALAAMAAGVAQRAGDGSVVFNAPPAAPVQRAVAIGEVDAAPAPPPPSAGGPPLDVDELYEKIRLRLKAELRLDRERMGMVSDFRS